VNTATDGVHDFQNHRVQYFEPYSSRHTEKMLFTKDIDRKYAS